MYIFIYDGIMKLYLPIFVNVCFYVKKMSKYITTVFTVLLLLMVTTNSNKKKITVLENIKNIYNFYVKDYCETPLNKAGGIYLDSFLYKPYFIFLI
jgi:hypothetical protein